MQNSPIKLSAAETSFEELFPDEVIPLISKEELMKVRADLYKNWPIKNTGVTEFQTMNRLKPHLGVVYGKNLICVLDEFRKHKQIDSSMHSSPTASSPQITERLPVKEDNMSFLKALAMEDDNLTAVQKKVEVKSALNPLALLQSLKAD